MIQLTHVSSQVSSARRLQRDPKNCTTKFAAERWRELCQMLTKFRNFSSLQTELTFQRNSYVQRLHPYLKHVATLPCETKFSPQFVGKFHAAVFLEGHVYRQTHRWSSRRACALCTAEPATWTSCCTTRTCCCSAGRQRSPWRTWCSYRPGRQGNTRPSPGRAGNTTGPLHVTAVVVVVVVVVNKINFRIYTAPYGRNVRGAVYD